MDALENLYKYIPTQGSWPLIAWDAAVLGLGGYPHLKRVEIAGRSLHKRVRNAARGRSLSMESNGEHDARAEAKLKEEAILAKYRKSIKGKNFINLTMYQQLGLTDVMFDATPDQIKKAYHRVLIEHHPDKTLKDENDPNYLAAKVVDFYALYGPVFERNARFSNITPVPALGDDETDLDTVQSFYNFWHTFDSWRDFTHNAEHDVDSVESRDEKRHMMKKNEVQAKKLKKKEYNRLADLVDRAQANDPRLRRVKQAAKDKKENDRKAKEAAAQAIIDAQKAAEEAAARAIAEKEEAEKKSKNDAKLAKDKLKKAFRKVKKPSVSSSKLSMTRALASPAGIEDVVKVLTGLRGEAYMQKQAAKRG
ncbi:hypothetical protein SPRG_14564 [Saprolegnia parasitica CBS 223.65]|uniref:J domain-containing protein n=1 Tax=Saprolegnia parasitica (strain CBS 223.65) TaxID=695850 RepID=A0A067BNZ7_SAPPC|nr:hypothetical protein SPRG_14564 [Saprolegnia parasitica CBS 223.65]KDO19983.1 hypothetical protein SPRG_14564 [Saprolegnia parasitica CBS 223.65]|eukprot:XP_012209288.1 hypothetical protein SPRG_14564 [Saprolegnia parasitica CBS 223.65]